MRTRTARLVVFEDESTGELGLGLDRMPRNELTNAVTEGFSIAHDVLEHVNGPQHIGGIEDELEALGALWFIRGQHGYLRRYVREYFTPQQGLASDLVRMARDSFFSGETVKGPNTRPCACDDDLQEVIAIARNDAPKEFDQEDASSAEVRQHLEGYFAAALSRMRAGFRKASKQHKGDSWAADSLFWAIADAVTAGTKNQIEEGFSFVLRYGTGPDGRPFATCEESFA